MSWDCKRTTENHTWKDIYVYVANTNAVEFDLLKLRTVRLASSAPTTMLHGREEEHFGLGTNPQNMMQSAKCGSKLSITTAFYSGPECCNEYINRRNAVKKFGQELQIHWKEGLVIPNGYSVCRKISWNVRTVPKSWDSFCCYIEKVQNWIKPEKSIADIYTQAILSRAKSKRTHEENGFGVIAIDYI